MAYYAISIASTRTSSLLQRPRGCRDRGFRRPRHSAATDGWCPSSSTRGAPFYDFRTTPCGLMRPCSARADEFHEGNLQPEIECSHRAIVASGGFEPNTLSVESLGFRSGVPHFVRGSHRPRPFEGVPTLKRHRRLEADPAPQPRHLQDRFGTLAMAGNSPPRNIC